MGFICREQRKDLFLLILRFYYLLKIFGFNLFFFLNEKPTNYTSTFSDGNLKDFSMGRGFLSLPLGN